MGPLLLRLKAQHSGVTVGYAEKIQAGAPGRESVQPIVRPAPEFATGPPQVGENERQMLLRCLPEATGSLTRLQTSSIRAGQSPRADVCPLLRRSAATGALRSEGRPHDVFRDHPPRLGR